MKKLVAQQTSMVEESATTDTGPTIPVESSSVETFMVILDLDTNRISLHHDAIKMLEFRHDDKTFLKRSFDTLLNTCKQKMRFWNTH